MSRQPIVRYLPAGVQCLTVTAADLRSGDQIVHDKETVVVETVAVTHLGCEHERVTWTGRIVPWRREACQAVSVHGSRGPGIRHRAGACRMVRP